MNLIQKYIDFFIKRPIVISFGRYVLLSYGLIIAITMFFGYFTASLMLQIFQVNNGVTKSVILITIPSLIILSRILPLFSDSNLFKKPGQAFKNQWYTYLGGFLGIWISGLFIVIYFKESILRSSDSLFLISPLFHAIGRTACINYGCCSIKVKEENEKTRFYFLYSNPITRAVRFFNMKNQKIYPVHIYEMFGNVLISFLLVILLFFVHYHGIISATYLFSYGLLRLILEPKRNEVKKIFLAKYSFYQLILTALLWIMGIGYLIATFTYKVPIIMIFNKGYIAYSLSLIPILLPMCILAFVLFGVNKIENKKCKFHAQCANNPYLTSACSGSSNNA
ncbi:MAG: prolipoprotein diacylglyceryl transferase [Nanoarchaeota archaeon]|nr:prolipoprotein diacylglyceryl transferase [Nanoarchaeota archaeon]